MNEQELAQWLKKEFESHESESWYIDEFSKRHEIDEDKQWLLTARELMKDSTVIRQEHWCIRNEFAELMVRYNNNNGRGYDLPRARELLLRWDALILKSYFLKDGEDK